MKYSYNWLKWYISEAPDAEKLAEIFTYHLAEVENLEKITDKIAGKGEDTVFDIKILPNRAHDLLSHMGLAKELSSLLKIKYDDPTLQYKVPESQPATLNIEIKTDKCRRYMGRIIRNVKVGPSPAWVVAHLEAIGQRSINNMVDAANLVMFNCGQPTHIFDMRKMQLKGGAPFIKIDIAKNTVEKFLTTLDKKQVNFRDDDMLIIDGNYDQPIALAGIKGGDFAEVDNSTTDIILEVANFDPTSVRKTAQALNIFTDARKRFENDLSPELGSYAMRELSALIMEICPEAIFEEIVDVYPQKPETRKLVFSVEKVCKVLGLKVSEKEIEEILERYNFEYKNSDGIFEINIPPMRLDLTLEEDMAEEIGRVLGYDKVKGTIPKVDFKPKANELYSKIAWARNKLINEGYSEIMTTSFKNKGKVSVLASASDKNYLRENLFDGLMESVAYNSSILPLFGLRNFKELKIFEIGTIWGPAEKIRVAYFDAAKHTTKPEELDLDKFCKDMPADSKLEHKNHNLENKFKMWALFPFIVRDVAVWVPENIKSEEVLKVIKENTGKMVIRGPELFDEFKKDGKVSYAFRIVFQSYDRTLTDAEVNEVMNKITDKIKENAGWQVR